MLTNAKTLAQATLDLPNRNVQPDVVGRRIEDLISGADRSQGNTIEALSAPAIEQANTPDTGNIAARFAHNGLDANALLDGLAQGQGRGQRSSNGGAGTSDVGGDIANQIAGGSSNSIGDIIAGLNGQEQGAPTNQSTSQPQDQSASQGMVPGNSQSAESDINSSDVAGDLANQLAPQSGSNDANVEDVAGDLANQLAPNGQGQLPPQGQADAQQNGGSGQLIEVVSTIITEANGQMMATALVEAASNEPTEASSSAPQAAATEAPLKASSASQSVITVFPPGMSPLPAVTPIPWTNPPSQIAEMSAGMESGTSAMEAAMSTETSAAMSAEVCCTTNTYTKG